MKQGCSQTCSSSTAAFTFGELSGVMVLTLPLIPQAWNTFCIPEARLWAVSDPSTSVVDSTLERSCHCPFLRSHCHVALCLPQCPAICGRWLIEIFNPIHLLHEFSTTPRRRKTALNNTLLLDFSLIALYFSGLRGRCWSKLSWFSITYKVYFAQIADSRGFFRLKLSN